MRRKSEETFTPMHSPEHVCIFKSSETNTSSDNGTGEPKTVRAWGPRYVRKTLGYGRRPDRQTRSLMNPDGGPVTSRV